MGNSEEAQSCKPEKPPSPALDQTNVHMYPDWAAMQAYYGQRVAVPPYFNSAVPPGHPPHPYMWGPPQTPDEDTLDLTQHMMSPYGSPYAAIYAHGGVYAHPGVPLGLHSPSNGVPSPPNVATPLSMDTPTKSAGNTDRGLMKKLKGFDGLEMSIGNSKAESAEGENDNGLSQSGTGETEGSSDGSDGNTSGAGQSGRKRSYEGTPNIVARDGNTETRDGPVPAEEANEVSEIVTGATLAPVKVSRDVMGPKHSPSVTTALELSSSPTVNTSVQPPCSPVPNETWLQNERELKREKRKQSNRESARRSRLRKQAEAEELAIKVDALTAENTTLKSQINRVTENSRKLNLENAKLMEKLKIAQLGKTEDENLTGVDEKKMLTLSTANLLSRVNNSGSTDRNEGEVEIYEKKSGAKLRQLLDTSPRTDAVAAS